MTRTTLSQILMLVALSLAGVWAALKLLARQGVYLPAVTWHQPFAILVLAVAVTIAGLNVRAYMAGKKPKLAGVAAARIAVFAKAASLGGALFVGWYGAAILLAAENLGIESQQSRALWAGIAAAASVVLVVCALIAERNCQIPPADSGEEETDPRQRGFPA